MKTNIQTLFYFCLMLTLLACGGGGGNDDPDPVIVPDPDPIPEAVNLIAPPNNSICVGEEQGNSITVDFEWSAVDYVQEYEITVYNASGTAVNTLNTNITSVRLDLSKNRSFTWNVKAKNDSGESISSTFSTTTPGEAVPNTIPSIKSIVFYEAENSIRVVVQDAEGDRLFYDAIAANNNAFENPTTYATNSEVSESANNPEEHEIQIENVEWTADFWFKFTLRDTSGNQIVGIKSQKF